MFKEYYFTEQVESDSKLMFHGTSDKFLKNIMQTGLKKNQTPSWNDETGSIDMPSSKTIGGIYLTKSPKLSDFYANNAVKKFGGNKLFVAIKVSVDDLILDEDTINTESLFDEVLIKYDHTPTNKYSIKLLNMKFEKDPNDFDNTYVKSFINLFHNTYRSSITQKVNHELLKNLFISILKRKYIYLTKLDTEEKVKAEKELQHNLDLATREYKDYAKNDKVDTVRIDSDISFSGNTHIVAIFSISPDGQHIEHYGKIPGKFIRKF